MDLMHSQHNQGEAHFTKKKTYTGMYRCGISNIYQAPSLCQGFSQSKAQQNAFLAHRPCLT